MSATVDEFAGWGPCDYVKLPQIRDHWKVVDIGPGTHPLRRADLFIDNNPEMLRPLMEAGAVTMLSNLESGLQDIPDKAFDYAWSSHVLEHVNDPAAAARTLSRIAKAGTIVMPSWAKDALFHFEERDHEWAVFPNTGDGPPIFVRLNWDYINVFRDQLTQKGAAFLYRLGSNHDCTAERHLRNWFQTHENHLDVVYHWQDRLDLKVVG